MGELAPLGRFRTRSNCFILNEKYRQANIIEIKCFMFTTEFLQIMFASHMLTEATVLNKNLQIVDN